MPAHAYKGAYPISTDAWDTLKPSVPETFAKSGITKWEFAARIGKDDKEAHQFKIPQIYQQLHGLFFELFYSLIPLVLILYFCYIHFMRWTVETLNENVDDELRALSDKLQARLLELVDRIELIGLENLREPHIKHIEGKLWELRAKSSEGIARGFYITAIGRRVVLLHIFVKKSQKTPKTALNIARSRMKEVQL